MRILGPYAGQKDEREHWIFKSVNYQMQILGPDAAQRGNVT